VSGERRDHRSRGLRRVFCIGLAGGDADRDVERELAFHFEETVRSLVAAGRSEGEAREEAGRRFGDERAYRRELSRLARGRDRRARARDVARAAAGVAEDAARNLSRAPLLAGAVVALLALGVGVNATMFGVVDRLFLTPPAHVEAPDQVRRFFVHLRRATTGERAAQQTFSYPDYRDWNGLEVFASTAAWSTRPLTVGHGAESERRTVTLATASYFPTLGVRPALGRFYARSEDVFGAEPVAVLSHAYWQGSFGGDPDVIGRTLAVGDATYTVIGVAPPGFTGVDLDRVDLWLPLHRAAMVEEGGTEWEGSRNWYWLQAVARLAPGTAPDRASAAATLAHRAGRAETEGYDAEARIEMEPLLLARTGGASREARVVPWLMGVALMVLLLTCANVANLLLARTIRRRRETAVRLALGVSRWRLVATVVLEAVVLALAGGAAAAAVALWGGDLLRAFLIPEATWGAGRDVVRVIAFSGVLALAAGLFAGVLPAWRSSRPRTTDALKASGRGSTRGRSASRSILLVFQAAVTVVLLVGTGLFVLSLRAARGVDLGFEPDPVLLVRIEPEGGYPGGEAMTALYRRALARVRSLPGVETASITTVTPFRNSRGIGDDLRIPGVDSIPGTPEGGAYITAVSGDYFETIGLERIRGRGITESDDAASAPRVAVVNRTMADRVWPDGEALGACLIIRDAPCATVVGVVEDHHRFELEEHASLQYYVPLAHAPYPWPPSRLMIRTREPDRLAPTVRRELAAGLPEARLVTTRPYRDVIDPSYRSWQLGAALFAAFGVLALLVAAVGLYSVLAFDVAERRPELGIRAALGASRGRIVRRVLADGVRLAGVGIGIGLAGALFGARRAAPLLFEVSPGDPRVLGAVGMAVLAVAVAASGIPAWRAARVDPNETLRSE
jgi:putative ABC transport system permease protein